jgi:serine/threonine protein kinase
MNVSEQKQVSNYILGKTIGKGTFNKVKIAKHIITNEQVAIKII